IHIDMEVGLQRRFLWSRIPLAIPPPKPDRSLRHAPVHAPLRIPTLLRCRRPVQNIAGFWVSGVQFQRPPGRLDGAVVLAFLKVDGSQRDVVLSRWMIGDSSLRGGDAL